MVLVVALRIITAVALVACGLILALAIIRIANAQNLAGYAGSVYWRAAAPAALDNGNTRVSSAALSGGEIPAALTEEGRAAFPVGAGLVDYSELNKTDTDNLGTAGVATYLRLRGYLNPAGGDAPEDIFNTAGWLQFQDVRKPYEGGKVWRLALRDTARRADIIADARLMFSGWPGATTATANAGGCTSAALKDVALCAPITHSAVAPGEIAEGAELAVDFYDALAEVRNNTQTRDGRIILRMEWNDAAQALRCQQYDEAFGLPCIYEGNLPAGIITRGAEGLYNGARIAIVDGGTGEDRLELAQPQAGAFDPDEWAGWSVQVFRRNGAALTPALDFEDSSVNSRGANIRDFSMAADSFTPEQLESLNGQLFAVVFSEDVWGGRIAAVPGGGLGFQLVLALVTMLGSLFAGDVKKMPLQRRLVMAVILTIAATAVPPFFWGAGNPFLPVVLALIAGVGYGFSRYTAGRT